MGQQKVIGRLRPFFILFGLASVFYILPNWNAPAPRWDAWVYQMQVSGIDQVPLYLKVHSAFSVGFVEGFVDYWHRFVGRYFISYTGIMQATAFFAQASDSIWFIFDSLFLSGSLAFFVALLSRMQVHLAFAWILALILFFHPAGHWNSWLYSTDAESPATFFLMWAAYLSVKSPGKKTPYFVAALLLLSWTCKETFSLYLPFILALQFHYWNRSQFKRSFYACAIATVSFIAFVLGLHFLTTPMTESYLSGSGGGAAGQFRLTLFLDYIRAILQSFFISPYPFDKIGKLLWGGGILVLAVILLKKNKPRSLLLGWSRSYQLIFLAGLISMALQLAVYGYLGKSISDFHMLPLNYISALFIGLFLQKVLRLISEVPQLKKTVSMFLFAFFALLPLLSGLSNLLVWFCIYGAAFVFAVLLFGVYKKRGPDFLSLMAAFFMIAPSAMLPFHASAQLQVDRAAWGQMINDLDRHIQDGAVIEINLEPATFVEAPMVIVAQLLMRGHGKEDFSIRLTGEDQLTGYNRSVSSLINIKADFSQPADIRMTLKKVAARRWSVPKATIGTMVIEPNQFFSLFNYDKVADVAYRIEVLRTGTNEN